MVVFAAPAIEAYSPAWLGRILGAESVHVRYYSLTKTNDLWLMSHTVCDALAKYVVRSKGNMECFFAEPPGTAPESFDTDDTSLNRISVFSAAPKFRDLAWGKEIRVRVEKMKKVDRSDALDLKDAENVFASMMNARRIGDVDWLAASMGDADRSVLHDDIRKAGGPHKLSQFLKLAAENYLKDIQLFATAMGADEKPYAIVAYVSKMTVIGRIQHVLNAVTFRSENGRWVSSRSRDAALCEEFLRACKVPFLLWRSESASEELFDEGNG